MSSTLSSERINEILAFNDEQRANYFFKEVISQQKIWILTDEHGCVMLNTEDEDCIPVWPNEEFAQAWATKEWQHCTPEAISMSLWLSRWSHGLAEDELAIVVFPSQEEQGLIYYPEELDHEFRRNKHKQHK